MGLQPFQKQPQPLSHTRAVRVSETTNSSDCLRPQRGNVRSAFQATGEFGSVGALRRGDLRQGLEACS